MTEAISELSNYDSLKIAKELNINDEDIKHIIKKIDVNEKIFKAEKKNYYYRLWLSSYKTNSQKNKRIKNLL